MMLDDASIDGLFTFPVAGDDPFCLKNFGNPAKHRRRFTEIDREP
jgi:hypothetical protein